MTRRQPFQNLTNTQSSRNFTKVDDPIAKPPTRINNPSKKHKPIPTIKSLVPPNKNTLRPSSQLQQRSISEVRNIDTIGTNDPLNVTEYAQDIYKTSREQEMNGVSLVSDYMQQQPYINKEMRYTLIDWILGVHCMYELEDSTLYLTVSILDRFLSQRPVLVENLQVLGASCLFIASKYQDSFGMGGPIGANDLVLLGDNSYSCEEIYTAEVEVLRTLDYRISFPMATTFLPRFLKAANAESYTTNIAQYMLDTTLLSYDLSVRYRPSQLAAAAVFIARDHAIGYKRPWSPTMTHYTGYSFEDILPVARAILEERTNNKIVHHRRRAEVSVNKKYSESCNGRVAELIFKSSI